MQDWTGGMKLKGRKLLDHKCLPYAMNERVSKIGGFMLIVLDWRLTWGRREFDLAIRMLSFKTCFAWSGHIISTVHTLEAFDAHAWQHVWARGQAFFTCAGRKSFDN